MEDMIPRAALAWVCVLVNSSEGMSHYRSSGPWTNIIQEESFKRINVSG